MGLNLPREQAPRRQQLAVVGLPKTVLSCPPLDPPEALSSTPCSGTGMDWRVSQKAHLLQLPSPGWVFKED